MIAYPIFEGHCCAMSAFAFVCWPRLANFTFAYTLADGSALSSDFGTFLRFARSWNRAGCEYPLSQRICP